MTNLKTPARGFTLLEVLVALAILAIALGAALRASSVTIDQAQTMKYKLLAQWCAENQLAEQIARKRWPAPGMQTGRTVQAGLALDWDQSVTSTANPAFRRIEIKVYANRDHAYALAQLVGFLTDPAEP
jgi:general secretion pathway protein I